MGHRTNIFSIPTLTALIITHFSLLIASCFSQQSIIWQRLYEGPYHYWDVGYDICQTTDGNFVMVGNTWVPSNMGGIYAIKLDQYGDTIWTKRVEDVYAGAYTIVSSDDGGCVITGGSSNIVYALKLNAYGNVVWTKYYEGSSVQCYDIQKTSDGGYIACGRKLDTYTNGYIIKIDSLGNLQWQRVYPSTEFKSYGSIVETTNGGYITAGTIEDYMGDKAKPLLTKIDNSGSVQWEKRYIFNKSTSASVLRKINGGGYLIGGGTSDSISQLAENYFMRVDTSGNLIYKKIFHSSESDYFGDLGVIDHNRFIIASSRDSTNSFFALATAIITDSMGNILKQHSFSSSPYLELRSILPLSNGDIILAGLFEVHQQQTRSYYYVIRTDSTLNAPPIGVHPISNKIPVSFNLYQNYPNPFNPKTKIKFAIPTPLRPPFNQRGDGAAGGFLVLLKIYDILGREIVTLVNQQLNPGTYEVEFDGSNFASGIYFYRLTVNDFTQTKKIVLVK